MPVVEAADVDVALVDVVKSEVADVADAVDEVACLLLPFRRRGMGTVGCGLARALARRS